MGGLKSKGRRRRGQPGGESSGASASEFVRALKDKRPADSYRERSLRMHGLICAKCAREFDHTNQHLLSVHHKDGNRFNNPPDGSNWENLCLHCHDDEHGRGLLADLLKRDDR